MVKTLTKRVKWVGKTDWELTRFHGDEFSTHHGTSYNSYLINDQKTALIDTVWLPYDREFVNDLKSELPLQKIDYIIVQHAEVDHSGALPFLLREIPETPLFCTEMGRQILRSTYHADWNFNIVKSGDILPLGETRLTFFEAPMLHWPDTMFSHLSEENILFSNDGFGQHLASESLYSDQVEPAVLSYEALKYYANILSPFSAQVAQKIGQLQNTQLPVEQIFPSHGVLWREHSQRIIEDYLRWADAYSEHQATVIYDSMWHATRRMAEMLATGLQDGDKHLTVKVFNAAKADKTDLITEIFRSKLLLLGSPTVNGGCLYAIAGLLELIRGARMKGKKAFVFGSYGWSGEATSLMEKGLREAGFALLAPAKKTKWRPGALELSDLYKQGKRLAALLP